MNSRDLASLCILHDRHGLSQATSVLLHMCVAGGWGQSFLQYEQRDICIVVASVTEAVFSPLGSD